jgi:hypothetical protein
MQANDLIVHCQCQLTLQQRSFVGGDPMTIVSSKLLFAGQVHLSGVREDRFLSAHVGCSSSSRASSSSSSEKSSWLRS